MITSFELPAILSIFKFLYFLSALKYGIDLLSVYLESPTSFLSTFQNCFWNLLPSFFSYLFVFNFYWSILDLQYCVCCSKLHQLYICIYLLFFSRSFPIETITKYWIQSSLCYTIVVTYSLPILYIVVCICQSHLPVYPSAPIFPGNH